MRLCPHFPALDPAAQRSERLPRQEASRSDGVQERFAASATERYWPTAPGLVHHSRKSRGGGKPEEPSR